jgi:hypothetical protein
MLYALGKFIVYAMCVYWVILYLFMHSSWEKTHRNQGVDKRDSPVRCVEGGGDDDVNERCE